MLRFKASLQSRQRSERGAIALEYVILAGLAISTVSVTFVVFGPKLLAEFANLLP